MLLRRTRRRTTSSGKSQPLQTFLPYPDFEESASCLDPKRLGKQRVEVLQIVITIQNPKQKGWQNHPCTNMWRPYLPALIRYGVAICDEWTRLGYADTVKEKLLARLDKSQPDQDPPWLGLPKLHASHRSNLLRKAPEFYRQFGWKEPDDLPYFWPE